jgi:hypothetical protein
VRLVSGLGADAEIASVHPSGEPASISGGRRCSALIAVDARKAFARRLLFPVWPRIGADDAASWIY